MLHTVIKYLLKNQIMMALVLIILGWFLVQIRDIIVSIFLSYIIMAAVLPAVEFLKRKKFPKILAVLIPYLGIVAAILIVIIPLIPFVVEQIQSFIVRFPELLDKTSKNFGIVVDQKQVQNFFASQGSNLGKNALNVTGQVFGGIFSTITIFVVSFYLLMYSDAFKRFMANLFHDGSREYIHTTLDKVNEKLGAWLRGEVVLMVFIGSFSWIGLTILGLPYALPLALLAGLLEAVPTLGPIMSAIPAIIVALTVSPTMALTVVVLYMLIQALENQLLVPKVMQKAVGLNPVVVILSIMIGANLMGIAGALLAIPFVSFLIVLITSFESRGPK